MAPHSSTLAWKIPWAEEPGRLQSMGSLRDTTERLHFHFSLSCIGEGNGNPLQCSCLENPRDGGAWRAAVYEIAQSRIWLKQLSSSSSSQGYGFSSSHVCMWELDYKKSWVPNNWCFLTVVLEKTLESPSDCKEIQSVHPKGDQCWVFIGRTDVEAETPILWPPICRELTRLKRPWCWERLKAGGEGDDRRWHHQHNGHEFRWSLGVVVGQGGLACCGLWGCKESDMIEQLNWNLIQRHLILTIFEFDWV